MVNGTCHGTNAQTLFPSQLQCQILMEKNPTVSQNVTSRDWTSVGGGKTSLEWKLPIYLFYT
jgi:hypothetical protein